MPVPAVRIGDEASLQIKLTRLGRRNAFIRRAARVLKSLVDGGGIGIENDGHGEGTCCC